jgi:phage regulator Rha-like protein
MPAQNQPSTLIEAPAPHQVAERIFTLRGAQVLLDRDLAEMYQVETKTLNRAVQRNIHRFPAAFCFQLSAKEWTDLRCQSSPSKSADSLRFQFGTLKSPGRGRHRKYLPYVFTEQGVAMLSAVLHSDTAVQVSIRIINAFVEMRRVLLQNAFLFQRVEKIEAEQIKLIAESAQKFEQIFTALESHGNQHPAQGIFFNGQIFDAYAFVASLIRKAKSSIILLDNYVDESVMLMLSKRQASTSATIFTRKISRQLALDLEKHNAQYPPIAVHPLEGFHDRFLIIDKQDLYHLGASLKDLGKQCFAFSKLDSLAPDILSRLQDSWALKS